MVSWWLSIFELLYLDIGAMLHCNCPSASWHSWMLLIQEVVASFNPIVYLNWLFCLCLLSPKQIIFTFLAWSSSLLCWSTTLQQWTNICSAVSYAPSNYIHNTVITYHILPLVGPTNISTTVVWIMNMKCSKHCTVTADLFCRKLTEYSMDWCILLFLWTFVFFGKNFVRCMVVSMCVVTLLEIEYSLLSVLIQILSIKMV